MRFESVKKIIAIILILCCFNVNICAVNCEFNFPKAKDLPDNLTESQRENFVKIIESQINYTESVKDWTVYGDYFGNNGVGWCVYFLCWCAEKANIGVEILPRTNDPVIFVAGLKQISLNNNEDKYSLKIGDIAANSQHAGIFYGSFNQEYFKLLGGNQGGKPNAKVKIIYAKYEAYKFYRPEFVN